MPRRVLWLAPWVAAASLAIVVVVTGLEPAPRSRVVASAPSEGRSPPATEAARAPGFWLGPHHVVMAPSSRFETLGGGTDEIVMRLMAGLGRFDIHPLEPGQTFRIETPHAIVEVIGTRFSVDVEPECTEIAVEEGRVHVTGGRLSKIRALAARHTERFCAPIDTPPLRGEAAVREALISLGQQRDLPRAQTLLARYVHDHDDGVFLEDALFHLTFVTDQLESRAEARRYAAQVLERFPSGRRADRLRALLAKDHVDSQAP